MDEHLPVSMDAIFESESFDFKEAAFRIYRYQVAHNPLYASFSRRRQVNNQLTSIPFLPISFFKTHRVLTGSRKVEKIFSSSGTTGQQLSQHFVCDLGIYDKSFLLAFERFYGSPTDYAILCLLPSYLEREGSSLIYMAEKLITLSQQPQSGFFLTSKGELVDILLKREMEGKCSLLLGVSFSLLDFAEESPMMLNHTMLMETGGMKGRRTEMTRMALHKRLTEAFGVPSIHSEYGMTELLSQAYSAGEGRYFCPPWMRVFVREEDDPYVVKDSGAGIICIMDLANVYSCCFIETADVGKVFSDGSFEILGRIDNSDIRGCSLLLVD